MKEDEKGYRGGNYEKNRFGSKRGKLLDQREKKIVNLFLKNIEPSRILDIPCGAGRLLYLSEENNHKSIYGIDNDKDQLEAAREKAKKLSINYKILSGDIFNIDLEDKSVDAVICMRLMHWFNEEQILKSLKELARVSSRDILISYYSKMTFEGIRKSIRSHSGRAISYYPSKFRSLVNKAGLCVNKNFIYQNRLYYRNQILWLNHLNN
ncbi:class I SAM-dependent methyltransferase [Verrucomicrobia bacterium]|nr:class I SAM-dependent methyltransferase [Verrucomicrobiota bacterium]